MTNDTKSSSEANKGNNKETKPEIHSDTKLAQQNLRQEGKNDVQHESKRDDNQHQNNDQKQDKFQKESVSTDSMKKPISPDSRSTPTP